MADGATVDYDALAKQYGETSSAPAQVDYDALAKQHGAISSEAPKPLTQTAPATPKDQEQPGFVSRLASSFGIPTSTQELEATAKDYLPSILNPGYQMAKSAIGYGKGLLQSGKEAFEAGKQAGTNIGEGGPIIPNIGTQISDTARAMTRAIPFVGGTIAGIGQDVGAKNLPGALGGSLGLALQAIPAFSGEARAKASGLGEVTKTAPIEPDVAEETVGKGIGNLIDKASHGATAETGKHAQHFVDNAVPIKPPPEIMKVIRDGIDTYFQTFTKIGSVLPGDLRKIAQEAIGSPESWTPAQAKDIRTALQEMRQMTDNPRFAEAVKPAIDLMTEKMRAAAKEGGVEESFDKYNKLHSKHMDIRDAVIDPVRNAKTGQEVMNILRGKSGYMKTTVLPSLERYGLEPGPIKEAMDIGSDSKTAGKLWGGWMQRYAGAAIGQAMGVPWPVGYIASGALGDALKTGKAIHSVETPTGRLGQTLVDKSITPGPSPLPDPVRLWHPDKGSPGTPVAPQLPPGGVGPAPIAQVPPRIQPKPSPVASVSPISPEVTAGIAQQAPVPQPASPYAGAQEAVKDIAWSRQAVNALSGKGKEPLSDSGWRWIEQKTGLDMTDPANHQKALDILKRKVEPTTAKAKTPEKSTAAESPTIKPPGKIAKTPPKVDKTPPQAAVEPARAEVPPEAAKPPEPQLKPTAPEPVAGQEASKAEKGTEVAPQKVEAAEPAPESSGLQEEVKPEKPSPAASPVETAKEGEASAGEKGFDQLHSNELDDEQRVLERKVERLTGKKYDSRVPPPINIEVAGKVQKSISDAVNRIEAIKKERGEMYAKARNKESAPSPSPEAKETEKPSSGTQEAPGALPSQDYLDRAKSIEDKYSLDPKEAALVNLAIDKFPDVIEKFSSPAEALQKTMLQAAAKSGVSMDRAGDLKFAKQVAKDFGLEKPKPVREKKSSGK
jgi:hypothetical protein